MVICGVYENRGTHFFFFWGGVPIIRVGVYETRGTHFLWGSYKKGGGLRKQAYPCRRFL